MARPSSSLHFGWILTAIVAFKLGQYAQFTDNRQCNCNASLVKDGYTGNDASGSSSATPPQQHEQQSAPSSPATDVDQATATHTENNSIDKNTQDGWHSIDVFFGNTSHLDATQPPPAFRGPRPNALQDWYGQAQQDRIVMELFQNKKNGFFVDLASNDARTYSNTFALERRFGWKGLCIEPNPTYWHDLSYRSCQVVAAVVGRHRMEEVKFRFQTGVLAVLGGIVDDKFDTKTEKDEQAHPDAPPTLKYTVPLLEILERYQAPQVIDYLSLDVEGAEEYIMTLFPFEKYRIRVMTIERPNDALQAFLKDKGFEMRQKITRWGETLWTHESFLKEQQLV